MSCTMRHGVRSSAGFSGLRVERRGEVQNPAPAPLRALYTPRPTAQRLTALLYMGTVADSRARLRSGPAVMSNHGRANFDSAWAVGSLAVRRPCICTPCGKNRRSLLACCVGYKLDMGGKWGLRGAVYRLSSRVKQASGVNGRAFFFGGPKGHVPELRPIPYECLEKNN